MLDVLAASGPFAEHADKLMLFGQLVGSWSVEGTHFNRDGTIKVERRGEWHFGWVLEGRAIQDVIISPPRAERAETGAESVEYGTTLRTYDPKLDAWRVTFVAPVYGATVNLIARQQGDEIVLEGAGPNGTPYRWVFSEITRQRFRWRGYESFDEGASWFLAEQILGRRRT